MDAQKNKALSRVVQCFLLFLVLRVIEELVIIPHVTNTMGLISSLGGLVVLLIYIRFINKPLDEIGMIFSGHKVRKGIFLSFALNIVPAVLVYWMEYRRYAMLEGFTRVSIFYENVSRSYSQAGLRGFILWTLAGLIIGVVNAFFYELSFRGLLITLGSRSLHFSAINTIQAALYTLWYIIPVIRVLVYYSNVYSMRRILILFAVTLVYELITAIKLGLLRYATGSVWVCIFDHILFAFILDMIHIQYTQSRYERVAGYQLSYYVRILAYQAVALLITVIYYFRKKKKIQEMQQEIQLEKHA